MVQKAKISEYDFKSEITMAHKARAVGISTIERGWQDRYARHVRRERDVILTNVLHVAAQICGHIARHV